MNPVSGSVYSSVLTHITNVLNQANQHLSFEVFNGAAFSHMRLIGPHCFDCGIFDCSACLWYSYGMDSGQDPTTTPTSRPEKRDLRPSIGTRWLFDELSDPTEHLSDTSDDGLALLTGV